MKTNTNVEHLECHSFGLNNQEFYILRYEDFLKESDFSRLTYRHNYYMVLFCTEGNGHHLIDFQEYEIKVNDIYLMFPGQIHAWKGSQNIKGYIIFFTPNFFNMRYHNNILLEFPFFNATSKKPFVSLDETERHHKISLFNNMLQEFENKQDDFLKVLRSYLNIILIEVNRIYDSTFHSNVNIDKNAALIVKNFELLINKHYKENHKVKDYAKLLNLTPNYLNAVCNKIMNRPAGALIRHRIMLEAKRLLLHEGDTVARIGHELGFVDNSYFCRFFKKYEHLSPEKFRKTHLISEHNNLI